MDKPIAPNKPIKPRKPNEDNIRPQKPQSEIFSSLFICLLLSAACAGVTILAINFYSGNIYIRVTNLILAIAQFFCIISGIVAVFLLGLSILYLCIVILEISEFIKKTKKYKKDLYEYNNNYESFLVIAMEEYNNEMEIYNSEYEEYQKQYAKYKKDLKKYEHNQEMIASIRNAYGDDNDIKLDNDKDDIFKFSNDCDDSSNDNDYKKEEAKRAYRDKYNDKFVIYLEKPYKGYYERTGWCAPMLTDDIESAELFYFEIDARKRAMEIVDRYPEYNEFTIKKIHID